MRRTLPSLFRVTAVRLSIIYTLIFGLLAIGIVFYMTGATVNVLRKQYEESIQTEVVGLARIFRQAGLNSVIRTIERRARAPGANLYVVTDPAGRIVAGNVPRLQPGVMNRVGWTGRPFRYYRFGDEERDDLRAVAQVLEVPNGMRILVGRDVGEHEGFRRVVRRGFNLALGTMVLLGLLTWFFVGRRALKRIDDVSRSSYRIMGGDKTERLPVSGAGDEFDRLSENLNHMLDRISRLNEGLKQMSDNIAHDLKTPITRLRNKADQALNLEGEPALQQEKIGEIIADCDQIVKTFDALLTISRVESGGSFVSFDEINLVTMLRDVHELYEAVVEEHGIGLELDLAGQEDLQAVGNRELLSQAISNLVDNSIKYAADDDKGAVAHIRISLEKAGSNYEIAVADNGPGIPQEDLERVKERFVRLDESRHRAGNGLGLSLVDAIARLHGGKLVLSDNQPGLRACMVLPLEPGTLGDGGGRRT